MGRTSNAKQKLIDSIVDLMWERSYGMVTIDQICQHAGVKKGSFYYFYKSKSELTLEALDYFWEANVREKLDSLFSPTKSGVQRLMDHADFKYEWTREMKQKEGKILACCLFTVGQEMCNVDQDLRNKVNDYLTCHQRYFTSAVQDAVSEGEVKTDDAPALATCIYSCYEGTFARARIANDPEIMRGLKDSYLRILGISAQVA